MWSAPHGAYTMSATSQSVEPEQFVGSSHDLETGDEIITNYGGSFDSWGKTVEEKPEMGEDHEDWFKVKGDWGGAACYDLWYSFRTSKWYMSRNAQTEKVHIYKV